MKKLILFPAFLFLIIVGCSSTPESILNQKQVTFLTNGIWLGMLPCADCEVIDYQLNLKNDFTFKQKSVYKGKSEEQFVDDGEWSFISDSVIVLNGSGENKLFLISGRELIMLDQDGNKIGSSFEDKYHLHKDASTVKEIEKVKDVNYVKPVKEAVEINSLYYQEKFLNGTDFIARGNEPNWTLEIDFEKAMNFATMDDIKLNTPAVEGIKTQDVDVTLYRAKTKSGELAVTVTKADCEDNMSGENFIYQVKVEVKSLTDKDYKTFEGCGKYLYDNRLYNIWVMEEMTGINLKKTKLTKGLPTFEFHFGEMRFVGHAGCNSLSGDINVVGNKITFGNLMGTLMSCPDMKVEKAVIGALNQKTLTYKIDKMKLTLVSGKTKMVLKKVD